jgi:hypothetical protein
VFERIQTEWMFGIDTAAELETITRNDRSDPRDFEKLALAHLARNPRRLVLVRDFAVASPSGLRRRAR